MLKKEHKLIGIIALTGLFLAVWIGVAVAQTDSADAELKKIWERSNQIGTYGFRSRAVQTETPVMSLENAGRQPTVKHVLVEGSVDKEPDLIEMRIVPQEPGQPEIDIEIREGIAYYRQAGGEWERGDGVTELLDPDESLQGVLQAAENVRILGADEESSDFEIEMFPPSYMKQIVRYRFDIDGREYAELQRESQTRYMIEKEGMPANMELELDMRYVGMEAYGELWVDANGLPVRQMITMDLATTEQNIDDVMVNATIEYFDWDTAALTPWMQVQNGPDLLIQAPIWFISFSGLDQITSDHIYSGILIIAGFAVLLVLGLLMVRHYRRPIVYTGVAWTIVFCMLIGPLIPLFSVQQAEAFFIRQAEREAEHEAAEEEAALQQELFDKVHGPVFNPHEAPVAEHLADFTFIESGEPVVDAFEENGVKGLPQLQATQVVTPVLCQGAFTGLDCDGDGLNDEVELMRTGTFTDAIDSDFDGISDRLEIEGFTFPNGSGGQNTWYLNPLDPDTNKDGQIDSVECPGLEDAEYNSSQKKSLFKNNFSAAPCLDTDGDFVPDVFDFDDDGDGVPDSIDNSPTYTGTLTTQLQQDFSLQLAGYELNKHLFVNLQIRPEHSNHLFYANNVLDWPTGDKEGQYTRVHTHTLNYLGITEDFAKGDNGDMLVTPMLEIAIPFDASNPTGGLPKLDSYNDPITVDTPLENWLDTERAQALGMDVRYNAPTTETLVYMQLATVKDTVGDMPVAWGATIPYMPLVQAWGSAHRIRLAWIVQGVLDSCSTPAGWSDPNPNDGLGYCDDTNNWVEGNDLSILHVYREPFTVSGLQVQQDYRMDAAIVAQRDAVDLQYDNNSETAYENYLWHLTNGLSATFLNGELVNANRFDLSEISRRFDYQNSATANERWGIPNTALDVQTVTATNQIDGMSNLLDTAIPSFLTTVYTGSINSQVVNTSTMVSLLLARESELKSLTLDNYADPNTPPFSLNGSTLSLSLANEPRIVMSSAKLTPFLYNTSREGWESAKITDYAAHLERQFTPYLTLARLNTLADTGPVIDEPVARTAALKLIEGAYFDYYEGLVGMTEVNGQSSSSSTVDDATLTTLLTIDPFMVQVQETLLLLAYTSERLESLTLDGEVIAKSTVPVLSPSGVMHEMGLAYQYQGRPGPDGKVGKVFYGGHQSMTSLMRASPDYRQFQKKTLGADYNRSKLYESLSPKYRWGFVAVAVSYIGIAAGEVYGDQNNERRLKALNGTAFTLGVILELITITKTVHQFRIAKGAQTSALYKAFKAHKIADGFLSFGVAIGLSITLLIVTTLMNGISINSTEFRFLLNYTIGVILIELILVLIIVAFPGVGYIFAALVAIIDLILALICDIGKLDENSFVCKGLTGWLAEVFAYFVTDLKAPVLNTEDNDRLSVTFKSVDLTVPELGNTTANTITINVQVDSKMRLYKFFRNDPFAKYGDVHDEVKGKIDDSSVKHVLQDTNNQDFAANIGLNQTTWTEKGKDPEFGRGDLRWETSEVITKSFSLKDSLGLNAPMPMYFLQAYAFPIADCEKVTEGSGVGSSTRTECTYNEVVTGVVDNYWGDDFKYDVLPATFSEFYNLTRSGNGFRLSWDNSFPTLQDADGDGLRAINDPNDSVGDADGDGLTDYWEVNNNTNPRFSDSDFDGISDYWEVFYGTNPNHNDSDGDTLQDGREIYRSVTGHAMDNTRGAPWVGGWQYLYEFDGGIPKRTLATSDPTHINTDLDLYSDYQEFNLRFNPRTVNHDSLIKIDDVSLFNGLVETDVFKLGDTVTYSVSVSSELDPTVGMRGLFETEFPTDNPIRSTSFGIFGQEIQTINGSIPINIADSQSISTTFRAGGVFGFTRNSDPLPRTNDWAEFKFDEPAGSSVFLNNSILIQGGRCIGVCGAGSKGVSDNGLILDGPSYIDLNEITTARITQNASMSIGAWIKVEQDQPLSGTLIGNATPTHPGGISQIYPNDGRWHHIAFTWEFDDILGNYEVRYLDGQRLDYSVCNDNPTDPFCKFLTIFDLDGTQFRIGEGFVGHIDEVVAFSNRGASSFNIGLEIARLPYVELHLDESYENAIYEDGGIYTYLDSNNVAQPLTGQCGSVYDNTLNCPTNGTQGVIRDSAEFKPNDSIIFRTPAGQAAPTGTMLDNQLSVSMWFYADGDGLGLTQTLVSHYPTDEMFQLGINSNGYVTWDVKAETAPDNNSCVSRELGVVSGVPVQRNRWNHIVAVYDNNPAIPGANLFVNNVSGIDPSATTIVTNTITPCGVDLPQTDLVIGSYNDNNVPSPGFHGRIDEVTFFDALLDGGAVDLAYRLEALTFQSTYQTAIIVDNDAPSVGLSLSNEQFVSPNDTNTVWPVTVSDPTSAIANIQATFPVTQSNGNSGGLIQIPALQAGDRLNISLTATDSVGNNGFANYNLLVDGTPPVGTLNNPNTIYATSGGEISLSGTIQDPLSAFEAQSQLYRGQYVTDSVRIELVSPTQGPLGEYSTIAGTDGTWQINYPIPVEYYYQTFDVYFTAADVVGNVATNKIGSVYLDDLAPLVDTTFPVTATISFTQSNSIITGTVRDLAHPTSGLVRLFHFEEEGLVPPAFPDNPDLTRQFYQDSSGVGAQGSCTRCLVTLTDGGIYGKYVSQGQVYDDPRFYANLNPIIITGTTEIVDEATISLWYRQNGPNADPTIGTLLSHFNPNTGQVEPILSVANDFGFEARYTTLTETVTISSPTKLGSAYEQAIRDRLQFGPPSPWWHHLAVTFETDNETPTLALYLDGRLEVTGTLPVSSTLDISQLLLGSVNMNASYDELMVYDQVLTDNEIYYIAHPINTEPFDISNSVGSVVNSMQVRLRDQSVINQGVDDGVWSSPIIDSPQATFSTWTYTVPVSTTSGFYYLDLKATDGSGNERYRERVWGGLLDLQPPQVSIDIVDVGNGLFDISCNATDDYDLDESSYVCSLPITPTTTITTTGNPTRTIEINSSVSGLPFDNSTMTISACDMAGNCASQSRNFVDLLNVIYVDKDATGLANGASWEDAFTSIGAALAVATARQEIWVADGVYYPAGTLTLFDGAKIYGGFSGTETARSQRNWATNRTIISGDFDQNDAVDLSGVLITPAGITGNNLGRLIDIDVTIVVSNNITTTVGKSATLDGLTLTGATDSAIRSIESDLTLSNMLIQGNRGNSGGAIFARFGDLTVENTALINNEAIVGGAIYHNLTLNGNTDIPLRDRSSTFTNVTVAGNRSTQVNPIENGGGLFITTWPDSVDFDLSNYIIQNSIVWGNVDNNGNPSNLIWFTRGEQIQGTVRHSLVEGSGGSAAWAGGFFGIDGGNNIDGDPLFVNLAVGNVGLDIPASPAYNTGNSSYITATLDLDHNARINFGAIDMGAYEGTIDNQPRYFVDTNVVGGTASGDSWANAIPNLQDALALASSDSEIWVAAGVYYPDEGNGLSDNDPELSFTLPDGVEVYGGFAGTETERSQRNPAVNITVLSGDVDQNDTTDANGVLIDTTSQAGNNSKTVVRILNTTMPVVLDGFSLTGAFEGGLLIANSPATISNALFKGNLSSGANGGGALYGQDSRLTLNNVNVTNNISNRTGGGMAFRNSVVTGTNVTVSGNSASRFGGGIGIEFSPPDINSGSTISFTDLEMRNNQAPEGGAIFANGSITNSTGVTLTLFQSEIISNTATGDGGAIYAEDNFTLNIGSSLIVNNSANQGGVLRSGQNVAADFLNVTLANNSAPSAGALVYFANNANQGAVTFTNSVMSNNRTVGVNTPFNSGGPVTVTSSLLSGSGGSGQSWPASFGTDGGNNIDGDPIFIDPTGLNFRVANNSPVIDAGSNSAYRATSFPEQDLDGQARIVAFDGVNSQIDMGAYERSNVTQTRFYVDTDVVGGSGSGDSWANAMPTVQDALALAPAGAEVWVAEGIYYPDEGSAQTNNSSSSRYLIPEGVSLYGGFAATETVRSQRNPSVNITVLSGDLEQNDTTDANGVVTDPNGQTGTNSGIVVQFLNLTTPVVFDGFTVTGATGSGLWASNSSANIANLVLKGNQAVTTGGGGLYSSNSTLVLTDVTLDQNRTSALFGGGLYALDSRLTLNNVNVTNNSSRGLGGGMIFFTSVVTGTDVTVTDNQTPGFGGGVAVEFFGNDANTDSTLNFTNLIMRNNQADNGGAIYVGGDISSGQAVTLTLFRAEIVGNSATADGGGIYVEENVTLNSGSSLFANNSAANGGVLRTGQNFVGDLVNVTLANNSAITTSGMIHFGDAGNPGTVTFANTLAWGNRANGANTPFNLSGPVSFAYSLVEGSGGSTSWDNTFGTDNGSNIDADPLFVDAANRDYRIINGSPAIAAGSNGAFNSAGYPSEDLSGGLRFVSTPPTSNSIIDIGADENDQNFNLPPVAITDTASLDEDTAATISVLANDTDPNGDSLSLAAVGTPQNGSAVPCCGGNSIIYSPNPDYNGTDVFTYTVSDGSGGLATGTVTVTVRPVDETMNGVTINTPTNQANLLANTPVTIAGNFNTMDDGNACPISNVDINVNDNGNNQVYNASYFPSTETNSFDWSDNGWTPTVVGSYSIQVDGFDFCEGSFSQTVTVNVVDTPVAVNDSATTDEDTPVSVNVLANDTYTGNVTMDVGQPTSGVVTNLNGTLTYTPTANFNGTDVVTYSISTGNLQSNTATVTLTVNSVADTGDVSCDTPSVVNTSDALFILQFNVGLRAGVDQCPLPAGNNHINVAACDVNGDTQCNSTDALFILQCNVGINNAFCPAP